jgi:Protein of unknown function (DUF3443)
MKNLGPSRVTLVAALTMFAALVSTALAGCSNSGSSSNSGGGGGGGGSTANQQAIQVNTGPALSAGSVATNSAFTSITICVPGSTSQCQTIDGVLVDTGSFGVRVLSSALTLSLPQQNDSGGNPLAECTLFVSDETWGPVAQADVSLGGEKASAQLIQVIGGGTGNMATPPTSCSNQGPVDDTLASFGANGILGVGNFISDCGPGCAPGTTNNPGFYYSCPSSGCVVTTVPEANQVSNPVAAFAKDNNGVIVELPSATAPEASLSGTLIFGIGTQSNNGLGGATVYAVNSADGNFNTTFKGITYTDAAFLDTGSNAIYFLDAATTGLPTCSSPITFWYCPASTMNFTATNQAFQGGATTTINFSVVSAAPLNTNQSDGVFPGLAGPNPSTFDWGLPFFYGRNVFIAIEGASTPGGTGPYVAY